MFCPKCGGILVPKNEKGKKVLVCLRCGYVVEKNEGLSMSESLKEKESGIIDISGVTENVASKTEVICPKCGNREAYYFLEQTRSADEPPTKIYKCTKCGYTWREYQ